MRYLLATLAVCMWIGAVGACTSAKTVIHEIAGLMLVLTGAVFLIGAAIVGACNEVTDELRRFRDPPKQ